MRDSLITYKGSQVEVPSSYVYLSITFTNTCEPFSMRQASQDRLSWKYAALERQCDQSYFQDPRAKGWLFNTL